MCARTIRDDLDGGLALPGGVGQVPELPAYYLKASDGAVDNRLVDDGP